MYQKNNKLEISLHNFVLNLGSAILAFVASTSILAQAFQANSAVLEEVIITVTNPEMVTTKL